MVLEFCMKSCGYILSRTLLFFSVSHAFDNLFLILTFDTAILRSNNEREKLKSDWLRAVQLGNYNDSAKGVTV